MDISILEDLGLTNAEIKIYLAVLELGTTTAGPIIRKTKLQNSVVHSILPKLAEKGFISFVKRGGIKEYNATNPENIINFIEEKKNRFEKILPELIGRQKKTTRQEAEVYQGFKGLKNMLRELIKDAKKGDEFLFFAFDAKSPKEFENVYAFYRDDYYKERIRKGLVVKGLAPKRLKETINKVPWSKKCIKLIDFPIPTNISICNNRVAFTPWEDQEVAFLINSRQLAESFREYFYSIWRKSDSSHK